MLIFFLCINGSFCTHFGVHFPHGNLETAGTDEVLFDKYTMAACHMYTVWLSQIMHAKYNYCAFYLDIEMCSYF